MKHLTEKYGQANTDDDYVLLVFRAPTCSPRPKLGRVADACAKVETLEHVHPGITPFSFLTFENRDGRLAFGTMGPGGGAPATDAEALAIRDRLFADPQARNLVISADGDALCAIFPVDTRGGPRPVLAAIEASSRRSRPAIDVRSSAGAVPQRAPEHMYADMPVFLGLACSSSSSPTTSASARCARSCCPSSWSCSARSGPWAR